MAGRPPLPPVDPATLPRLNAILVTEQKRLGLSDADLCRATGLSQTTLRHVTRTGQTPTVDTLMAVLGGLGRDLAWLHRQGFSPAKPAKS